MVLVMLVLLVVLVLVFAACGCVCPSVLMFLIQRATHTAATRMNRNTRPRRATYTWLEAMDGLTGLN